MDSKTHREGPMNPLEDLQCELESFAHRHETDAEGTLWSCLLASALELRGSGCDGKLVDELTDHATDLLDAIDDELLPAIWHGTEHGRTACDDLSEIALRQEMLDDILLDLEERLVGLVCREVHR